eukprot:SAG11_NODE_359_length_10228_cov_7.861388_1_plen_60_part_00
MDQVEIHHLYHVESVVPGTTLSTYVDLLQRGKYSRSNGVVSTTTWKVVLVILNLVRQQQ